MADPVDIFSYNGNFLNIRTSGGIPVFDIAGSPTTSKPDTSKLSGRQINIRQTDEPWQIVYGRARIGGTFAFARPVNGYIHIVYILAGHKIDGVEYLYLDKQEIPLPGNGSNVYGWATGQWANVVFCSPSLGDPDQAANADLLGQADALFPGEWTGSDRLRNRAYLYLILAANDERFPEGLPEIEALVRGKPVYDPRSDTVAWSRNATLCALDLILDRNYGLGADYGTEINHANMVEAADISDEAVTLAAGGTEPRYTCDGVFYSNEDPSQIINNFRSCLGFGTIQIVGPKWEISPAKWRDSSLSLNAGDLRGDIRVQTKFSKRSTANGVKGTYVGAENKYQLTDFPVVKNALYLSEDGEEIYRDIVLPFTSSASAAQRIAKILLEDSRQQIQVEATFSLKAFQAKRGDTISFTYDRLGWVAKEFRVIESKLNIVYADDVPHIVVVLKLKETTSGIYAWSEEETTVDLAPNTVLPDPRVVVAPTGIVLTGGTGQLYRRVDGTIFSRIKVSWTAPDDAYVLGNGSIEIQYKQSSDGTWNDAPSVQGSSSKTYILDVQDGQSYDVRIRSVNGLGYKSAYLTATNHIVAGKTDLPSQVQNFRGISVSTGLKLEWDAIPDLDISHYELRFGSSWESSTFISEVRGTQFVWQTQAASTYNILIKAVDTSRNQSLLASSASVFVPTPGTLVVSSLFSGPNIIFSWAVPTSFFQISDYRITYGSSYAGSVEVSRTKSTSFSVRADWSGVRKFWFVGYDIHGNAGTETFVEVSITSPGVVGSISASVIRNNVILDWEEPATGTLPIAQYRVYRGDTFGAADLVGAVAATFATRFEMLAGRYVYWVVAEDTAGNLGSEKSVVALVSEPPDFVLKANQLIDLSSVTMSDAIFSEDAIFAPVTNKSWEDHFLDETWTTPQDQIDDGYPIFIQPGATNGYIEKVVDLGTTIGTSLVSISYDHEVLDGSVTVTPLISWSPDNSSYTAGTSGNTQEIATTFRYVKIRISFAAGDRTGIAKLSQLRLVVSVQQDRDNGSGTANSGDSGGTTFTLNKTFLDVEDIKVQVYGTTAAYPVVDYNFAASPAAQTFKVLVFNDAGTRVTKDITWEARGTVEV